MLTNHVNVKFVMSKSNNYRILLKIRMKAILFWDSFFYLLDYIVVLKKNHDESLFSKALL